MVFAAKAAHTVSTEPRRIESPRGVLYVFTPPDLARVEEYIGARHKLLDRLFFREPGKKYEAQISFSRYVTEADIRVFSQRHELSLNTLNFGWAGQTGGHSLERGETLETAFRKVREHYEGLLSDLGESVVRASERENGPEDRKGVQQLKAHADELSKAYRAHGTRYFGAKVYGSVESLKFSKDENSIIRLVDVLWAEESDAGGTTAVRKLSVPVVPLTD